MLREACRLAVEIGGYRMAWAGYALDDDKHRVLPMAHAVDGMRQLMYGGADGGALVASLGALAAWLVGSLAVAALAARRQSSTRRLREIRPSAIGG